MKNLNIYLTGMMGAGKSTVGPILAKELGWSFVDLDQQIESRVGMTISQIFHEKGETHFRDFESELVHDVSRSSKQVVALGGGTILRQENRRRLKETGTLIYLESPLETLAARLLLNLESRPLLIQNVNLKECSSDETILKRLVCYLEEVFEKRKTYYQEAQITIDSSSLSVAETVVILKRDLKD